jgi:putative flippase GtrA
MREIAIGSARALTDRPARRFALVGLANAGLDFAASAILNPALVGGAPCIASRRLSTVAGFLTQRVLARGLVFAADQRLKRRPGP